MRQRTVVVIPCFNEESRLDAVAFERFLTEVPTADLLFVNDGSTDGTLAILRRLECRSNGRIDVHDLPTNSGKAEAVRQGMLRALSRRPRFVGFFDADLATPLNAVPVFVNVLERLPQVELVLGSRLPLLGRQIVRQPVRKMMGKLFVTAASRVLGLRVVDTQCGAKMFRATPETHSVFSEAFLARWIFDVEILARFIIVHRQQCPGGSQLPSPVNQRLYELPLDFWQDVKGSTLRSKDFRQAAFDLAQIYRHYFVQGWKPRPADDSRSVQPGQTPMAA